MNDYIDPGCLALLQRHRLDSFDALWNLDLTAIDRPNLGRGGWSSVSRLDLEGTRFFVKRQSNYLKRSFCRPFGEPTAACEFRNILRYQAAAVPCLQAVFFAQRRIAGERRALLVTRALEDWSSLEQLLPGWQQLPEDQRGQIIVTCAELAGRLHVKRLWHGCFYPKHLFVRRVSQQWQACLIDLEKTRGLWLGWRDQIRDLEPFLRRVTGWSQDEQLQFLTAYLGASGACGSPQLWLRRLSARRAAKEPLR